MPTFLIIKSGKVIQTIRGANPPALNAAVKNVVADVAKSAPKPQPAEETKANTDGEGNEETVSGGYSKTKGSEWKMSLN
jgi:thioredoxin 1